MAISLRPRPEVIPVITFAVHRCAHAESDSAALNGENDMDVHLCVCRSYGACRDLDAGSYKDFAPTEHDLGLPNVQTPGDGSECRPSRGQLEPGFLRWS